MQHLHRRAGIVLAVLVLTVGIAGCSDSGTEPKPSSTRSTPSESTPPTTSAPPSTSFAPATGEKLEIPALTLHLTEGPRWLVPSTGVQTVSGTYLLEDGYPATVTASDLVAVQDDLEADARAFLEVSTSDPRPNRLENRTIDGVESWAAEAVGDPLRSYWVGGIHGGRQWSVRIETPTSLADAETLELRERIIASIEFA